MYPVVEIKCTDRDVTQKADVLEQRGDSLRLAVQGTSLAIDLRRQGNIYVGRAAGLEFTCTATPDEINAQRVTK